MHTRNVCARYMCANRQYHYPPYLPPFPLSLDDFRGCSREGSRLREGPANSPGNWLGRQAKRASNVGTVIPDICLRMITKHLDRATSRFYAFAYTDQH